MQNDAELLTSLNIDIGKAESKGDKIELDKYLASSFAFRRADGTIVGREFVDKIKPGGRETKIESVKIHGNRAVVECVVTITETGKKYHNLRLFVREEKKWKLLGWANEEILNENAPDTLLS